MSRLQAWITANPGRVRVSEVVDPVAAAPTADDRSDTTVDRSIRAREAIQAAQELVTLAAGAFLDGSSWLRALETPKSDGGADDGAASASMSSGQLQELRDELERLQLSPTLRLVLALLHERARKSESRFAGYIEQLPARIPLPMTWSDRARRRLKRTAAYVTANE